MWTHVHSVLIFKGIDVERKNMHMQNKALLVSRPPQEHSLGHRTTAKRAAAHAHTWRGLDPVGGARYVRRQQCHGLPNTSRNESSAQRAMHRATATRTACATCAKDHQCEAGVPRKVVPHALEGLLTSQAAVRRPSSPVDGGSDGTVSSQS